MMTISRNRLSEMPFFRHASSEVLDAVLQAGIPRSFAGGEIIMEEGSLGREMYLLIEGSVAVLKLEGDEMITVGERCAGELVGEMALIDAGGRSATVQTREPTVALEFSADDMQAIFVRDPALLYQMVQGLTSRLRRADLQMIGDLTHKNQELARAYAELKAAQAELVEKERLERELEIARQLQQSMLPRHFPELPGYSVAVRSRPARQIGGDFYDVIPAGSSHAVMVMADVSDKGMPAALYMALARSLIRAEAKRSLSPRDVLLRTHRLLMEISHASMFFTAFCGILDLKTGMLRFARAGHDRPLLRRAATGECLWLDARGTLLGFMVDACLEEAEVQLSPGDVLVLYTDGITDANDPNGRFFGDERLMAAVSPTGEDTAEILCNRLFDTVEQFRAGAVQFDDMAIMVLVAGAAGPQE